MFGQVLQQPPPFLAPLLAFDYHYCNKLNPLFLQVILHIVKPLVGPIEKMVPSRFVAVQIIFDIQSNREHAATYISQTVR